ncbi:hypothetical protein [Thermococcus litoralis]|uniref:hypothetical protein n=1 Tax=Thermococcus litoralis TaxID=2265 RepID=UPI000B354111|nr:hypothetical protein [Thermococcus litoralis]
MRWLKVWVLIALLVGSMIPAGLSLADENTTMENETEPLPPEIQNITQEKRIAEHIVAALERLSEITTRLINNTNLPDNSSVMRHYQLAEEYKKDALAAYESGDYYNTIINGLTAMHHYREVLKSFERGKEELKERLPEEIKRMEGYFRMAERTIEIAQKQGIDVENATMLLQETKEAYKTVLEDIKARDFEKAKEDLEVAREKKAALDEELKKIRKELVEANADKIVNEFLEKGARGIEVAEKVIEAAGEKGYDASELQERLEAFREVYDKVKALADEGKYDEALQVMRENTETIKEFHKAMAFIQRKFHEREAQEKMRDMRAFLREINGRIQKDAKALRELKRKGVDTRKAELQLKTSIQEVRLGIELLKHKKPAEAKMHFAIALDMLHRVDEFILRHL